MRWMLIMEYLDVVFLVRYLNYPVVNTLLVVSCGCFRTLSIHCCGTRIASIMERLKKYSTFVRESFRQYKTGRSIPQIESDGSCSRFIVAKSFRLRDGSCGASQAQ